mmetsp:Transcript_22247/g.31076  ORF Transcript_22247/g.31076 Transcript_22247/m.31076 type:complete len:153 (+) Transcript_22247:469-927(+)
MPLRRTRSHINMQIVSQPTFQLQLSHSVTSSPKKRPSREVIYDRDGSEDRKYDSQYQLPIPRPSLRSPKRFGLSLTPAFDMAVSTVNTQQKRRKVSDDKCVAPEKATFLFRCATCKRSSVKDGIFMYQDAGFCSDTCRSEAITVDGLGNLKF